MDHDLQSKAYLAFFINPKGGHRTQRLTINCRLNDLGAVDENKSISGIYTVLGEEHRQFKAETDGSTIVLHWEDGADDSILTGLMDKKIVEKESKIKLSHGSENSDAIEFCCRLMGIGPNGCDIYKAYRALASG